jgi:hypothetical protein
MHNCASALGGFPPAKTWSGSCSTSNGGQGLVLNTTAFALILNFMEQVPLANAYNYSQASNNEAWHPYGTSRWPKQDTCTFAITVTAANSFSMSGVIPANW